MTQGGWRGGGRPKIHTHGTVKAQFLLTPETDNLLDQLSDISGSVRSEIVRQLILTKATSCALTPCARCMAAHPAKCVQHG